MRPPRSRANRRLVSFKAALLWSGTASGLRTWCFRGCPIAWICLPSLLGNHLPYLPFGFYILTSLIAVFAVYLLCRLRNCTMCAETTVSCFILSFHVLIWRNPVCVFVNALCVWNICHDFHRWRRPRAFKCVCILSGLPKGSDKILWRYIAAVRSLDVMFLSKCFFGERRNLHDFNSRCRR